MKTTQRKNKITLLLSFFAISLFAQTDKGMWSAGGNFSFSQYNIDGESGNLMMLEPELAYVFHPRWMVWAQINIALENKFSTVGHQLNLRYAYIKRPGLEGYAGIEYTLTEERFLINGNTNKKEFISIGPFGGYLYFLNQNTALDFSIHYPLYRKTISQSNSSRQNGDVELRLGLNFYFNPKVEKDTSAAVPQLKKGQWMLGGNISFGKRNVSRFRNDIGVNRISPYAGLMLSKHWMVGSRLFYVNTPDLEEVYFGLQPFGRYYFRPRKKKVFYGEAGLLMYFRYLDNENYDKGFSGTERSLSLGLGSNRWITKNIVLDFYLGGKWGEMMPRFTNEFFTIQEIVFRIGLEVYLGR